ncbi:MAG: alpha/beta hydrolase, partial [Gammaproteobacteria bacterium]|nr:alpha/beta hydrolase [Gammaproteobacteria bacterium]
RAEQWKEPAPSAQPGMPLINLARQAEPRGKAFMDDEDLDVFVQGFEESGFTGGINWYRNFTRNWHILGDAPQVVEAPALMIYGQYDMVPKSPTLEQHVPNVEVHTLECGHWIQQEKAAETNALMLDWLGRHYPA